MKSTQARVLALLVLAGCLLLAGAQESDDETFRKQGVKASQRKASMDNDTQTEAQGEAAAVPDAVPANATAGNSTAEEGPDEIEEAPPAPVVALSVQECVDNVAYPEFATDDDIISCIRNSSKSCCEAMDRYLGRDSQVYLCTCSGSILEDVLAEVVPSFATDLIDERIKECGLPVAGDEICEGLYDDSGNVQGSGASCSDDLPPDVQGYTCKEQADFGKCSEGWMDGYCLNSCGKCEEEKPSAAAVDDDEDTECVDEKSPEDNSDYDCDKQAEFGKCSEGWMEGYCLKACNKCSDLKPASNDK